MILRCVFWEALKYAFWGTLSIFLCWYVVGCGGLAEREHFWLIAPDKSRSGIPGEAGKFGVAKAWWWYQQQLESLCAVEVFYPSDGEGALDASGGPYPIVGVGEELDWLAYHLVSRGALVVRLSQVSSGEVIEFFASLEKKKNVHGFKEAPCDTPISAIDALRRETGRAGSILYRAADRNSLAAYIALYISQPVWKDWAQREDLRVMILLGAPVFPVELAGISIQPKTLPKTLISLIGSQQEKRHHLPKSSFDTSEVSLFFGIVDGLFEQDWLDGSLSRLPKNEGLREEAQKRALQVIDVFLDAHLRNDSNAQSQISRGTFAGISWKE